jgi:hypothetical protein
VAPASEKILVIDRGDIELAYPGDWDVQFDPSGHVKLVDPADSCSLEVSNLRVGGRVGDVPPLETLLTQAISADPNTHSTPVSQGSRGTMHYAWVETSYDCDDSSRGETRPARARYLAASNGCCHALLTFAYWVDDATWAVPIWARVLESLQLGDGVPLADPLHHWALRERH